MKRSKPEWGGVTCAEGVVVGGSRVGTWCAALVSTDVHAILLVLNEVAKAAFEVTVR